jgi:Virulence factor
VAGELTVIRWRDIPMQVVARGDGGASARRLLPDRFQEAVDAAAMVGGLIGSDDYTEQMTMDRRACGDDLEAEVQAEADRLEADWTEDVMKVAIRSGGVRGGADVAGTVQAMRPTGEDA